MNAANEHQKTCVHFGRSFNRRRCWNSIAVAVAVAVVGAVATAVKMRQLGGRGTCGTCPNGAEMGG